MLLDLNCSLIRITCSELGAGIAYCKHIDNWMYAPVVCNTASELLVPTNYTTLETNDVSADLRLLHCMLGMNNIANEIHISQSN